MIKRVPLLLLFTLFAIAPLSAHADIRLDEPNLNVLTQGLVGYWPLDGNTTSWISDVTFDASGSGHTGALFGLSTTSSPVAGKIGQALNLNGNGYIDMTGLSGSYSAITVSTWFKANSITFATGDNPRLVTNDHTDSDDKGFQLMYNYGGSNGFFDVGTGADCQASWSQQLVANQWYHYVGVYDGTHAYAYLNGVLVGTSSGCSGTIQVATNDVNIGRNPAYSGDYFDGSEDDVRIYNRALSPQEIQMLYVVGSFAAGNTPARNSSFSIDQGGLNGGLVGYWPLDGNTTNWKTDTTSDVSGNGLNGQLLGLSTTTSPVAGKIGQALTFNPSSANRVTLGSSATLNPANFTIIGWIRPNASGSNTYDLIYANAPDCCTSGKNGVMFGYWGGGAQGTIWNSTATGITGPSLPTNMWTFLAFSYDGAKERLYVNGVQAATPVTYGGGVGQPASYPSVIGGLPSAVGNYSMNGAIDDVRLYNRALSDQEIAQLYHVGQVNIAHSNTSSGIGINSGLVGYWTFDGPTINWRTDTVADMSGSGNTAQMQGMSTSSSPVAGKIGQALKFNGNNTVLLTSSATNIPNPNAPQTLSAWVKFASGATQDIVVAYPATGGANQLRIDNSNYLEASQWAGPVTITSYSPLTPGAWHFVAWTWTGALNTLYVDGQVAATDTTAVQTGTPAAVYIGNYTPGGGGEPFDGAIDDVRIYNRPLSLQEIQQLYQMGR